MSSLALALLIFGLCYLLIMNYLAEVECETLFFFIGLFVLAGGLVKDRSAPIPLPINWCR